MRKASQARSPRRCRYSYHPHHPDVIYVGEDYYPYGYDGTSGVEPSASDEGDAASGTEHIAAQRRKAIIAAVSLLLTKFSISPHFSLSMADVTAWYCLEDPASDSISAYDISRKDAANNYYVYSRGNVIYVGEEALPRFSAGPNPNTSTSKPSRYFPFCASCCSNCAADIVLISKSEPVRASALFR